MNNLNFKKIGEGMCSNAYLINDNMVLLEGKREDSFSIYGDLKKNMDLLEGKISTLCIPSKLQLIEPTNEYPFGALKYLCVIGNEIDVNKMTIIQKQNAGKIIAKFIYELHNSGINWSKENSILHEQKKVEKNLALLKPYFNKTENLFIENLSKNYYLFLRYSDFCITHGDLHSENILVNNNMEVCGIIDFGNMAYCPPEFDFAPILHLDSCIFDSLLKNYPQKINVENVKLCLIFRAITFFEYVQNWSEIAINKEVESIRKLIFD